MPRLKPLTPKRVIPLLYFTAKILSQTYQTKTLNDIDWRRHHENSGNCIFCLWHQQIMAFFGQVILSGHYNPFVIISSSQDGEIAAGVMKMAGWRTIRGSSSKGGTAAVRACRGAMQASHLGAHVLDGPRGPMGVVKPGIVFLSHLTHAAIVPAYVKVNRAWFLNSWDRFCIPKPFAKITIHFGNIIKPDNKTASKDMEVKRLKLQRIMQEGLML